MIRNLLLILVGVTAGVVLAYFAVLILRNWILPVACGLVVLVTIGFLVWLVRGGLKKEKRDKPGDEEYP